MSASDDRIRDLIAQQAADWFVANRAGLTDRERAEFSAWLQTSPLHVQEYLAVSTIARTLRAACAHSEPLETIVAQARQEGTQEPDMPDQWKAPRRPRSGARWMPLAAAACVLVILGAATLWSLPTRNRTPAEGERTLRLSTRHGEQKTYHLADDSVVHLNTDTHVTVRDGASGRSAVLDAGEAVFEVAHDPRHPFRVLAGAAEIVDIGTTFDVRMIGAGTRVTVMQGRIALKQVSPGHTLHPGTGSSGGALDDAAAPLQLGPGQQIEVTEQSWPTTPITVDPQRTTAWMHRQIVFEHEPLERVASEFNRYAAKPFVITTPALRQLEISGTFATDDSEAFIAFLRSLEGVQVDITDSAVRVSQR